MSELDVATACELGSATLHEAGGRIGNLPSRLLPVGPSMRAAGPAYPVQARSGDNLLLHRAIYAAPPGSMLVVATGDTAAVWGYWGEIMSVAAVARGLAGLVLEGGSRDSQRLVELGFPVFSLGQCIRGTAKDPAAEGALGAPVRIGDVTVTGGDLVVGDADGVVVIPGPQAGEVIRLGVERERKEERVMEQLRAGATTLELYQLGA